MAPLEVKKGKGESSRDKTWTTVHDRYERNEVLGEGTYGVVFQAQNLRTGQRVAMKRSRLDIYDEGLPPSAVRELALLRDLSEHPNVVQLHEVSCNSSRLYMVCECLDYDLKKYLKAHNRRIPYPEVKSVLYQILKGISWCHGHRVMHRDLKPHNILLDKDASTVKLADFGLARPAHAAGKTITHEVITLWYRPPELLMGGCNYSDAVDIWSTGCILAELLSGQPIFMGDCEVDTLFKIFKVLGTPTIEDWPSMVELPEASERENWPKFRSNQDSLRGLREELDDDGVDLLRKMLVYDPAKRITAVEALQHPWFSESRTPRKRGVRYRLIPSTNSSTSSTQQGTDKAAGKASTGGSGAQQQAASSPSVSPSCVDAVAGSAKGLNSSSSSTMQFTGGGVGTDMLKSHQQKCSAPFDATVTLSTSASSSTSSTWYPTPTTVGNPVCTNSFIPEKYQNSCQGKDGRQLLPDDSLNSTRGSSTLSVSDGGNEGGMGVSGCGGGVERGMGMMAGMGGGMGFNQFDYHLQNQGLLGRPQKRANISKPTAFR
eukprot:GHVN01005365.1.p1 GENE.GHVN01005365.1~~GHVN01005365.1.p1  ORF type:complete len:545 (+),score=86.78 GHVN01005365.1:1532-3166(+)